MPESFSNLGDVLPIELKEVDEENKDGLIDLDCFKDINTPSVWSEETIKKALGRFKLIKRKKISYDKPILIIYNPHSGKKIDLVPLITVRLETAKIPFVFKPTEKTLDPFIFAKDFDLD